MTDPNVVLLLYFFIGLVLSMFAFYMMSTTSGLLRTVWIVASAAAVLIVLVAFTGLGLMSLDIIVEGFKSRR